VKVKELLDLLKRADPEEEILLNTPYFCGLLESASTDGGEVLLTAEKHL
jgi:hypothetical protein